MAVIGSIISGHWNGYYEYDSSYDLAEYKGTFRLILEDLGAGRFRGKCVDLDGATPNSQVASVDGFMEGSFISFTKEYPVFYYVDENGNEEPIPSSSKPLLTYMGQFDWLNKIFSGTWEMVMDDETDKGGDQLVVSAGTWKMSKA